MTFTGRLGIAEAPRVDMEEGGSSFFCRLEEAGIQVEARLVSRYK